MAPVGTVQSLDGHGIFSYTILSGVLLTGIQEAHVHQELRQELGQAVGPAVKQNS